MHIFENIATVLKRKCHDRDGQNVIWKTGQQKIPNQNRKVKRIKKYKDSLSDLWENIKHINIHIIG